MAPVLLIYSALSVYAAHSDSMDMYTELVGISFSLWSIFPNMASARALSRRAQLVFMVNRTFRSTAAGDVPYCPAIRG